MFVVDKFPNLEGWQQTGRNYSITKSPTTKYIYIYILDNLYINNTNAIDGDKIFIITNSVLLKIFLHNDKYIDIIN